MTIKTIAKKWLPPILRKQLISLLGRDICFVGQYAHWAEASGKTSGYDSDIILERVKQAMLKVKSGVAVFERDSVLFDNIQYSFPVLAGLLRVAVENNNQLSVLDFGGSLGSSYYQYRNFLSVLSSLEWNVIEQEHFVRCGIENFSTCELHFFYSINACLLHNTPKLALLSSVLQYMSDPYSILDELIARNIIYIMIDRTPFSELSTDFVTIQHVPPSIYKASYPSWIFSRQLFLTRFCGQYELLAEFDGSDGTAYVNNIQFKFGGMILRKL